MNRLIRFLEAHPVLNLCLAAATALLFYDVVGGMMAGAGVLLGLDLITGSRGTAGTNAITQSTRVVDMSDKIYLLDPNLAPLTALMQRARKQMAVSAKYEWHEDEYLPDFDAINWGTDYTSVDTNITVDNGTYFRVGDVIKSMETGEVMDITSITGNILTILRSVGGTIEGTLLDDDQIMIIGNANPEGAGVRTIKTTKKEAKYNYTQIIRTPMAVTNTQYYSELYGGNDLTWQHKKLGKEHLIDLEMTMLFGERGVDDTGTHRKRFTGGLIERITSNIDIVTTLTRQTFETFLRDGFRYGGDTKIFFASRKIMSYLSEFALSAIETRPEDQQFGIAIKRWNSPHGTCLLVNHNLLQAGPAGSGGNNVSYDGWGILVDMDAIQLRYLRERDTHLRINIQAPDIDGRTDEYLSEVGLQVIHERNHAILNGVAGMTTVAA